MSFWQLQIYKTSVILRNKTTIILLFIARASLEFRNQFDAKEDIAKSTPETARWN